MSRTCMVCGGLIPVPNEVLGYGGSICNGLHGGTGLSLEGRVCELELRVVELLKLLQALGEE